MKSQIKKVRIFISSPGDVIEERSRAKQVIEQLRRRYAGRLTLEAVLWEDLPLQADLSFQEGIDIVLSDEHGIDIALFILWSRLGTPLGALITKEDGTEYRSGTEREYDLMLRARAQAKEKIRKAQLPEVRPGILVYLRDDDSSFDERLRGKSTEEKESLIAQKKLVEQFISEEFHDPEGFSNIRAYHSFNVPSTFSQRLRVHLQELLDSLASDVEDQPVWDIVQKGAPFRGLDVFDYEHADVFFGREDEILELRQALREQARNGCAFVLISGASGSGKSSIARAGVLPTLVSYEIDETIAGWRFAVASPGQLASDGLLQGLARLLMSDTALPELRSDDRAIADITEGLAKDPQITYKLLIKQAFQKAAEGKSGAIRLVLLIDQFEELLTDPCITDEDRIAFVKVLDVLARSGSVWVMATVRSDFYERCEQLSVLMVMKGSGGQFSVQVPGADALRRLITEPARLAGLRFESRNGKTLDSVIIDDASQYPELLPLLEYLLLELYRSRTKENVLTFEAYENFAAYTQDGKKLGGIRGALAKRAEETYRQVNPSEAVFASIMNSLITIGGDEEESPVRRTVPLADVTDTPEKAAFVKAFVEARLFASQGEPPHELLEPQYKNEMQSGSSNDRPWGGATVSVSHEALFKVWGKAANWIEANREFLRVRAQISQRMQQGGVLLPGDPLFDRARAQLAQQRERFVDKTQVLFIEKAIADAKRKEKRIKKIRHTVIAGLLFLVLVALGGMVWALLESAKSTQLTIKSQLREAKITWRPRTQSAIKMREFPQTVLYAGRALGFRGYGYERLSPDQKRAFDKKFPQLFDFKDYPQLYQEFRQPMIGATKPFVPIWSSPVTFHHEREVTSVAFSPNSKILASGSRDNTIKLWDVTTGIEKMSLVGHSSEVTSVMFSPDGKTLASGSNDKTIKLWDVKTGIEKMSLVGHSSEVTSVMFSPDGKTLASTCSYGSIKLWDVVSGERIRSLPGHVGSFTSLAFSPDGKTLACGYPYSIKMRDVTSGEVKGSFPVKNYSVDSVAFSPDGDTIAIAGYAGPIKLWDVASGKVKGSVPGYGAGGATSVAFSPNGETLATSNSWGRTILLWDVANCTKKGTLSGHGGWVTSVVFSPDGMTLASGSRDRSIKLWNVETRRENVRSTGHVGEVTSVAFSPDGKLLASGGKDMTVRLWDMGTGNEVESLAGYSGSVTSVAFSPNGKFLAIGSYGSDIKLWDMVRGEVKGNMPGRSRDENFTSVAFSPDSNILASTSSYGYIRMWDVVSGEKVGSFIAPSNHVSNVAFSSDGKTLAAGNGRAEDNAIKLWDISSHTEKARFLGHESFVTSVAFSPDDRLLASGSNDNTIKVWDLLYDQERGSFSGHKSRVTCVTFSPDGTTLASASEDKTVRLWNVRALWDPEIGKKKGILTGHLGSVYLASAFSPDSKILASTSSFGSIKLWDVASGKEKRIMKGQPTGVYFVTFSPDGKILASSGWLSRVNLWDVASGELKRALHPHLPPYGSKVINATFSPDGKILASVGSDKIIKLWDIANSREKVNLAGHKSKVTSVAFSPDGKILASVLVKTKASNFGMWQAA